MDLYMETHWYLGIIILCPSASRGHKIFERFGRILEAI